MNQNDDDAKKQLRKYFNDNEAQILKSITVTLSKLFNPEQSQEWAKKCFDELVRELTK